MNRIFHDPQFAAAVVRSGTSILDYVIGCIPVDLSTIPYSMRHDPLVDSLRIHINNLRFMEHGSQDPGLFLSRKYPNFPVTFQKCVCRRMSLSPIMGRGFPLGNP